jgi:hypothetical protein
MQSFFDQTYQTPLWLTQRLSRRKLLKSAAGASLVASLPRFAFATPNELAKITKTDPWLTLDVVLQHLLPSSNTGPGAIEIQATNYLYQMVQNQPIEQDEKAFIQKGVGWLNGYSQSQLQKNFALLTSPEKEQMLRAIAGSRAGENWINTLLNYIFEAMLSPPVYGGNPNGIGWQWLKHQAGFPLPKNGDRYYEIPTYQQISVKNVPVEEKTKS